MSIPGSHYEICFTQGDMEDELSILEKIFRIHLSPIRHFYGVQFLNKRAISPVVSVSRRNVSYNYLITWTRHVKKMLWSHLLFHSKFIIFLNLCLYTCNQFVEKCCDMFCLSYLRIVKKRLYTYSKIVHGKSVSLLSNES